MKEKEENGEGRKKEKRIMNRDSSLEKEGRQRRRHG